MTSSVSFQYSQKTLLELIGLQEKGHLNLEPGFQRKSVWRDADRRKLIETIFENYPIPSIFLYKREREGKLVYDVIDGKQRLETIFRFTRTSPFGKLGFAVRYLPSDGSSEQLIDWSSAFRNGLAYRLHGYMVQTVEVSGEFSDIVSLFIRINSTGKSLTTSEKTHARYYSSNVLREANRLARQLRPYLRGQNVLSDNGVSRMKDVELISELLISIASKGPINRKTAIDRAIGNETVNANTLGRAKRELLATVKILQSILPDLRATRFRNSSEFYSLLMVAWDLHANHKIFLDRQRNHAAGRMLTEFSNRVDQVRLRQKEGKSAGAGATLYREYLLSSQHQTDSLRQREIRGRILKGILSGLFEKKDGKRLFSEEQRRLLWNSEDQKVCSGCKGTLTWDNFELDHVLPHSRGGRTDLSNAALICRSCNARKGSRHSSEPRR